MTQTVVRVPLAASPYDVVLGSGILSDLPALLSRYCPASRYAIIADSHVAETYGARVRDAVKTIAPVTIATFTAGEWNKTRENWAVLTDELVASGLDRNGAVLALGGGVAGDLAGFVAATFHRGIPYVQIPTTLLAMIDASVGGKTGVDTPVGKNLVGAFHQPRAVIADVDTLATLPKNQFIAGLAEALKHGAVADRGYFERLLETRDQIFARDRATLVSLVARSVEIKAQVVAEDERENGKRAVLNFGHTVGHAVETAAGYAVLHGEAVATGMAVEADLGVSLSITEAADAKLLRDALVRFNLPIELPGDAQPGRLIEAMRRDKKSRDQVIRASLIKRIGEPARGKKGEWTTPIDETAMSAVLESAG